MKLITTLLLFCFFAFTSQSQTISTFENITLSADSWWNGQSAAPSYNWFNSGNASFNNSFDTAFGGVWAGFAVSNIKNDTTYGFGNQYASYANGGYNSANYVVAYLSYNFAPVIRVTGAASGKSLKGCYITNSTFAALDMKNGSPFSKKFGGTSGNDSDFFRLKIYGHKNGVASNPVIFYLADYRGANDYIIKEWTWLDLSSLGNIDSLTFGLESSDNGQFGMNTPSYFCIDGFTTADAAVGLETVHESNLQIYPNPAQNHIYIQGNNTIQKVYITDMNGQQIRTIYSELNTIDISELPAGIYFLNIQSGDQNIIRKFAKTN